MELELEIRIISARIRSDFYFFITSQIIYSNALLFVLDRKLFYLI